LLLPSPGVCDDAVTLDPLGLERGAHHGWGTFEREDQGDEALAAPGIVAREILVVGPRRSDEQIEPPGGELGLGAREAALENLGGKGGLLGRTGAECGVWSAE
jgi:hypothetical protein